MSKHLVLVWVTVLSLILAGFSVLVLPVRGDAVWEVQVVDEKAELQGLSLALDSNDHPHMVYPATPSGNSFSHPTPEYLTYASWNGSNWNTQIVVENGYVGCNALAFDSKDTPHIVYVNTEYSADSKTLHYFVNYATWKGTYWSTMVIDGGVRGSLAVDSRGNPHIAYAQENGVLKYASWTGSNWSIQVVDPGFLRPPRSNGEIIALQFLTLDANDNPCIVYGDESTVKVAMGSSFGWSIQTVLSGELLHLGNIAVDSYGYPHFTYVPVLTGVLMYESWNGSAWGTQKVADKIYSMLGSFVQLDSRDDPHMTYISFGRPNQGLAVYYAGWNGTGWGTQMIAEYSYFADTAPFALDSKDNPHIGYLTGRGTGDSYRFYADGIATYATINQPNVPDVALAVLFVVVIVAAAILLTVLFKYPHKKHLPV